MRWQRWLAVVAACSLAGAGAACSSPDQKQVVSQKPSDDLPVVPVRPGMTDAFATTEDLVRESYVVARGRFVQGPQVVTRTPEGEELAARVVVWRFVPDEVYRDVRFADSPPVTGEKERGSILVAARVNGIGVMRGAQPFAEFVTSFESIYNLNSFPLDVPVYVFLRRGSVSDAVIKQHPDLAHLMGVTGLTQCYPVDDLGRSCTYAADVPGGEPQGILDEGALVPRDLSLHSIKRSGSVAQVTGLLPSGQPDPTIDTQRYEITAGAGSEG